MLKTYISSYKDLGVLEVYAGVNTAQRDMAAQKIVASLSIALYGMFIAIIIPEAKKEKSVLITVISAMLLSCGFYYLPFIKEISDGFRIIIITIAVSALMAVLFPRKEEQDEN